MSFDVVTIGSATLDYFADTDSELIKIQTRTTTEELIAFPLGSKLLIKELNITTGGGGTNTAVAFARLGFNTGYLGKVGEDANGDLVITRLKEEGVTFIGPREGQTGLSMILNSIQQDRSILAYKGANNFLRCDEIEPFASQWVYLSSMLEQSLETVIDLLREQPCKLAFNPSNYQAEMGYEKLAPLIDRVDILIMNKEEATKFLGLLPEENHSIAFLMQKMAELPPRVTLITDGREGAYAYDGEAFWHGQPTPDIHVVEATGAGDAFAASFTAAQMMGKDTRESLHLGMTNAESVLQNKGAKERLLSREELLETAASIQRNIRQLQMSR